eukprot:972692_1
MATIFVHSHKTLFTITFLIPFIASNSILIENAGFEEDYYPIHPNTYYYTSSGPLNWTRYNPAYVSFAYYIDMGVCNPSGGDSIQDMAFDGSAPQGHQVTFIDQSQKPLRGQGEIGIYQILRDVVTGSTTYTLSVWVANPSSNDWSNHSDDGGGFYNCLGFPGYKIELIAFASGDNGDPRYASVLAQDDDTLSPFNEGEWKESVVEVHIPSGDPNIGKTLGIRLINKNVNNSQESGMEVYFDDVRLQTKIVPNIDKETKKKKSGSLAVVILLSVIICVAVIGPVIVFVWWKNTKDVTAVALGHWNDHENRKKRETEDNALVDRSSRFSTSKVYTIH